MIQPDQILRANAETYRKKNSDYGNSWRLAGETLSLWLRHAGLETVEIDTDPETWNSLGLFTRRLDKLIRAFNAEFVVEELNFESTADAHEDESTYGAMHASLLRADEDSGREAYYPDDAALARHEVAPKDENGDPIFDAAVADGEGFPPEIEYEAGPSVGIPPEKGGPEDDWTTEEIEAFYEESYQELRE